jgi:uncharacterized protein (TIGR03118 family)
MAALLGGCGGGGGAAADFPAPNDSLGARNAYMRTHLAASKTGYGAGFVLPEMVNAWGIAIRPAGTGGHFWVQGGGTSWQFVGDVRRSADPALRTLFQDGLRVVQVPGADARTDAGSLGKSTGTAFNGAPLDSARFRVSGQRALRSDGSLVEFDGSARFVFVTDSGVLSAWTERASDGSIVRIDGAAQTVFDGRGRGMRFFGCAFKTDGWDALWVADFGAQPQIRQFDAGWNLVPTQGFANPFATGADGRPRPGDPVPFNVWVVQGRVFVPYCISQPLKDESGRVLDYQRFLPGEEDALDAAAEGARPARGKLVEYDLQGRLVRVFDDDGRLNAPWGVAIAPPNFGRLAGMVLVGNFGGAGRIAAFNDATGRFVDFMRDAAGEAIGIPGLWALQFGNGASLGDSDALYFAAGPEDETAGLFGALRHAG